MSFFQLLFLSLIQGISEFLPISSSGHLNLAQFLFNLSPSLSLDVFLNTATLFSVLFVFRRQVKDFFVTLPFIVIATLPAVFFGLVFKDSLDFLFSQIQYLPLFFITTSLLLFSQKYINPKKQSLTWQKALIIGFFQALALFPGVSRSASTLFACLLVGLSPKKSFQFTFFLFIPASLGALALNITEIGNLTELSLSSSVLAFLITLLTGIFCLRLLQKLFSSQKLYLFSFYTLLLSFFTTLFLI